MFTIQEYCADELAPFDVYTHCQPHADGVKWYIRASFGNEEFEVKGDAVTPEIYSEINLIANDIIYLCRPQAIRILSKALLRFFSRQALQQLANDEVRAYLMMGQPHENIAEYMIQRQCPKIFWRPSKVGFYLPEATLRIMMEEAADMLWK